MNCSQFFRATLVLAAASGAGACGPTHDCECTGRDVNASIWGTDDGGLFVAGYNGLDRGIVKTSSGAGFKASDFFDTPLRRGWDFGVGHLTAPGPSAPIS